MREAGLMTLIPTKSCSLLTAATLVAGAASTLAPGTTAAAADIDAHPQRPLVAMQGSSPTATRLSGFGTSPVTMRLGGEISRTVTVTPRGVRRVALQYQRNGSGPFRTLTRGQTDQSGRYEVRIHPPSRATWKVRVVIPRTAKATAFRSKVRTVRVKGVATNTRIAGFDATPAAIALGASLAPSATISPRGLRTVELQTKRPGGTSFAVTTRGRSSATGAFATVFKPAAAGTWTYRLVVRANATDKAAATAVRTITVSAPVAAPPPPSPAVVPPVAALFGESPMGDFRETSLRATVDAEVGFDASGSGPGSGSPIQAAVLDFGDGTTPLSFTGDPSNWQAFHAYPTAGSATANLTVLNTAGGSASATVQVRIFDQPTITQINPFPAIAKSPADVPIEIDIPAGTAVINFVIDFLDDSPVITGGSLPASVTHTFDQPGLQSIEVDLCTDANFCGFGFLDVQVEPDKTTAWLTISTVTKVGTPLPFNIVGSYAGPGATLTSAVLTSDDGVTPPVTVPPGSDGASITFTTEGGRLVTLTVTDSLGGTATFGALVFADP